LVIGKGPIENSNLATPPLLLTMVENCRPAYRDSFCYKTRTQEKKSSITLEPTLDGYAVDEQRVPTPAVDRCCCPGVYHASIEDIVEQ
jgi:hypothetical protein